jgi:hypothetical protein
MSVAMMLVEEQEHWRECVYPLDCIPLLLIRLLEGFTEDAPMGTFIASTYASMHSIQHWRGLLVRL